MNGISSFWNGLTNDGGTNIKNIVAGASGSSLTDAQREANQFSHDEAQLQRDFNANEAALQRDWSAAEAERARDWNEEMYAKYNSLSGKIAQAEQSGVNPLLAVTGNAVSPLSASASAPSGAAASGAAASSSVSPSGHSLTDLLGTMMGFMKMRSEIDVNEARAAKDVADAGKTDKESSWIDRLSQAQLDELVASTEELSSRLGVNDSTANKLNAEFSKLIQETSRISQITDAEKKNLEAQTALANFQRESANTFKGLDVGSDVLNTVIDLAIALIERKTHLTLGR